MIEKPITLTEQGVPLVRGENLPGDKDAGTYSVIAARAVNQGTLSIIYDMNMHTFYQYLMHDGKNEFVMEMDMEEVHEYISTNFDEGPDLVRALNARVVNLLAGNEQAILNDPKVKL